MFLCPICRHKDSSCKVRFLGGQQFFSCKSCFEREEKRLPRRSRERDENPLERLGYLGRETLTRE